MSSYCVPDTILNSRDIAGKRRTQVHPPGSSRLGAGDSQYIDEGIKKEEEKF